MHITKITDHFSVSPQIQYDHVKGLASQGYAAIINHRPDGEEADQPLSKALAKAAKQAGIQYHYIPFKPGRATTKDVQMFKTILETSGGPVLAFCRSGMRARSLYKTVHPSPGFFAKWFGR